MILSHRNVFAVASMAVGAVLCAPQTAQAQQTADLLVTASVADACTVAGGSLPFGEYTPGQSDLTGSGTFDVTCTIDANVDVRLDAGLNLGSGDNGDRAMSNEDGTDFLSYRLYQASDFGTQWGDDGNTHEGIARNFLFAAGTTNVTVSGIVPNGQTPVGGEYSDTVQISLAFN